MSDKRKEKWSYLDLMVDQVVRIVKLLGCALAAFLICAALTAMCGCSRVVSEDIEEYTLRVDSSAVESVDSSKVSITHTSSSVLSSFENIINVVENDSAWLNLVVREYGDDGHLVRETEANYGRTGNRNIDNKGRGCISSNNDIVEQDSLHVDVDKTSSAIVDNKIKKEKSVKREPWLKRHWRLCALALCAAIAVLLILFKKKKFRFAFSTIRRMI